MRNNPRNENWKKYVVVKIYHPDFKICKSVEKHFKLLFVAATRPTWLTVDLTNKREDPY